MTGAACATFLACIPLANWLIGNVGTEGVPQGPCLLPVGFGLTAPSGVVIIGIALVLRDFVQRNLGVGWTMAAIVVPPPSLRNGTIENSTDIRVPSLRTAGTKIFACVRGRHKARPRANSHDGVDRRPARPNSTRALYPDAQANVDLYKAEYRLMVRTCRLPRSVLLKRPAR